MFSLTIYILKSYARIADECFHTEESEAVKRQNWRGVHSADKSDHSLGWASHLCRTE